MTYISRGTAIARLTALEIEKPGATMADARRALWNMSGERVAEVIHGRWAQWLSKAHFCPNCRVKMDLERLYPPDGPGAEDPGPPGEPGPIDRAGKQ